MPKIMIVDDDATIQMELEEYLHHMEHTVVGTADTGAGSIEMAREKKPDLILMDINLPGEMDGISAALKIKEEMDVAVVFITGFGDPEYIERAKRVEPFGYVMKPFDEQEINGVIEIALYKKEMEFKLKAAHDELEQRVKDEKQPTDVNRVIEKTIDLVQTQLKKSGVTLNQDLSPRIPSLTTSPQQLNQVFLNLFNNAIEAMTGISKSNGGETGLIRRGEINVKTNLRKGHVVIKVTDNGPGIPKEDLEHIFDPFYTRKKKMGLGVGLSVCHDIVKGHGGTIVGENAPEGGAVFTITLPLG